jgi:hypothetical protein
MTLATPGEIDRLLRLRPGEAERLAIAGRLPHVVLPTGDVRFRRADIERLIADGCRPMRQEASHA